MIVTGASRREPRHRREGSHVEPTFLSAWGTFIAVALWAGAALGLSAVTVAVMRPPKRRRMLLVAALLFLPIGVFGILSIGSIFVVAAVSCAVIAAFSGASAASTTA